MHTKDKLRKTKIKGALATSSTVAHELRTPLATIHAQTEGLKEYLPSLVKSHQLAQQAQLPVDPISKQALTALKIVSDEIEAETISANMVIDMLLTNISHLNINPTDLYNCSMRACIQSALLSYPFGVDEKELVHFNEENDFMFLGKEILMVHVVYNLLKNSIYYIKAARKGEITIWLDSNGKYNEMHFKDTATGISSEKLLSIFEWFYSERENGTGLGLSFCRNIVRGFGGEMLCYSKEGEFAEFVIKLPK